MFGIILALVTHSSFAYIDSTVPPMSHERLQQASNAYFPALITNLDQLPGILPEDFKLNFVLKHGIKREGPRGHLFETKVSQSADPLLPRAIVWDERNGYTISYNGGGIGQTAGQRLDVMSFDSKTKTFNLEKVDFPLTTGGVLHFTSKGTDCLSCHGPNARPIFSMYPDWPSFYGSDNDELLSVESEVQQRELADYTSFLNQTASTHPRYKPLYDNKVINKRLKLKLYQTFPYRYELGTDQDDPSRAFAFRPGLRLGILYNRQMAQSLMEKIKQHPKFPRLGKFFLYNLLQCGTRSSDMKKSQNEISRAVTEARKLGSRTTLKNKTLMDYRSMWSLFDLKLNDVDIRFSYNHKGFENTDATNNPMGVGYIGNYFNSYFDGSATIDELMAAQLYSYYSERHPGLSEKASLRGLSEKYARFTERMKYDKNFFSSVDSMSLWFPIPYPSSLTAAHHREIYQNRFTEQLNNVCSTLEGMLWWPTRQ